MSTIVLVQSEEAARRRWRRALRGVGGCVVAVRSLTALAELLASGEVAVIVVDLDAPGGDALMRWLSAEPELPPLVLVGAPDRLPPLSARTRGVARVPRGRLEALRCTVAALLTAWQQPSSWLPLRLPRIGVMKWSTRLRAVDTRARSEDDDTWPGDQAA